MSSLLSRICQSSRQLLVLFKPRQGFLTFIFFLVLSGVFWLFTTLNENFDEEFIVSVRIDNLPKNLVIISDQYDSIRVTVHDKGYNLLDYYRRRQTMELSLNFRSFARMQDKVTLPQAELIKQLQILFGNSAQIVAVKPEKLELLYCMGRPKTVPVVLQSNVKLADNYYLSETRIEPNMVTVYGTEETLKNIRFVKTMPLNLQEVSDTVSRELQLQPIQGVRVEPKKIKVTLCTDIFMEDVVEVPVIPDKVPQGLRLKTFPSRVKVKYTVGISSYKKINKDLFSVQADYESVANGGEKCQLVLVSAPEGVKNVALEVNQVDYLIENDNSDNGRDR